MTGLKNKPVLVFVFFITIVSYHGFAKMIRLWLGSLTKETLNFYQDEHFRNGRILIKSKEK